MRMEDENYKLENRWEGKITRLRGNNALLMLWSFLMLFAGFLLGIFFKGG